MENDEEATFEKIALPGGVWRLVPVRPYHADRMHRYLRERKIPLILAHQVTPRGLYPDVDEEIDQILRDAARYRELKRKATESEKPLPVDELVPRRTICLASCVKQFRSDPLVQEVPMFCDWRKLPSDNEIGIKILLANDWLSRKQVRWNLIPYEEFRQFMTDDKIDNLKTDDPLYSVTSWIDTIEGVEYDKDLQKILSFANQDVAITRLHRRFQFLPQLFARHGNHLAVAGGALTRLFCLESPARGAGKPMDVDIFFHSLLPEQATVADVSAAEERAAAILKDCVALLCTLSPAYFRVENKEYVTNVFVLHPDLKRQGDYEYEPTCYQFIKRLYPRPDAIIGGFDLGPSMLLYDGKNIYGTELGAWSIVKSVVVIDTTRRSLTFEKRIHKLWRLGFGVIFPGIRERTMQAVLKDPDFDQDEAIDKIVSLVKSLGLVPKNESRSLTGYEEAAYGLLDDVFVREIPSVKCGDLQIGTTRKEIRSGAKRYMDAPFDAAHWTAKASDYNDQYVADYRIDAVASASLRCNNLDAVFTYFVRDFRDNEFYLNDNPDPLPPIPYSEAFAAFSNLLDNPVVICDPFYRERVDWLVTQHSSEYRKSQSYTTYFAEFGPTIKRLFKEGLDDYGNRFIARVVTILEERMRANVPICEKRLTGLKWISQEPGRQWTSSIKPIREAPVDFYGIKYYTPFLIGIPRNVESVLRLVHKKGVKQDDGSVNHLAQLPRDVFLLLLKYIWRAFVYNLATVKEVQPLGPARDSPMAISTLIGAVRSRVLPVQTVPAVNPMVQVPTSLDQVLSTPPPAPLVLPPSLMQMPPPAVRPTPPTQINLETLLRGIIPSVPPKK